MQYGNYPVRPPGYPMPVHFSFQVAPPIPGVYPITGVYPGTSVYPGTGMYSVSPYAAQADWSNWSLWNSWGGHAQ